jgi:hypothetical protein
VHAIEVESALQVIDFVLENSSVPSGSLNRATFSTFVEVLYADRAGSRNHRGESGYAETAFVEGDFVISGKSDSWIDDRVKVDRPSLPLDKVLGWQIPQHVFAILDHRKLQRDADLGCSQTDARSVMHGFFHVVDQPLDLVSQYLVPG